MPTPINWQSLMHCIDKDLRRHLGSQNDSGDGLAMSAVDVSEKHSVHARCSPSLK